MVIGHLLKVQIPDGSSGCSHGCLVSLKAFTQSGWKDGSGIGKLTLTDQGLTPSLKKYSGIDVTWSKPWNFSNSIKGEIKSWKALCCPQSLDQWKEQRFWKRSRVTNGFSWYFPLQTQALSTKPALAFGSTPCYCWWTFSSQLSGFDGAWALCYSPD